MTEHPDLVARTAAALASVTAALPGGEERAGQEEMAAEVARIVEGGGRLVVQAGTGTGKSLAYLVPVVLSGRKVVVATATKALQDQLASKDLPFLAEQLRTELGRTVGFAVLKGRSNYLCRQRLAELNDLGRAREGGGSQLALDGLDEEVRRVPPTELAALTRWAEATTSGDRADLDVEPSPGVWPAVSVGPRECPGAARCPSGGSCFAERARAAAQQADVVVVNTHLYGAHVASRAGDEDGFLPHHDVVVVDEAHQLEDTISATAGAELATHRLSSLARAVSSVVADDQLRADLAQAGDRLGAVLAPLVGRRLRPGAEPEVAEVLALTRSRVARAIEALRAATAGGAAGGGGGPATAEVAARAVRATLAASAVVDDIDAVADVPEGAVAWVEGTESQPVARSAPIDVGEVLAPSLWATHAAVLTSATIPAGLGERLGAPDARQVDVGSPFDYEHQALLYCAAHLPDPRQAGFEPAAHDELADLVEAAGGRTLALFTSFRAMHAAVGALRGRLAHPVLAQDDLPKPALLARFAGDEATCLFATMGFWQGVDVPGRALTLVTIDRIPFPRPDDPLLQARRERARADAFRLVDLPRAATLLAQGAGRLVRTRTDRGVVAVLDPRLATNQRYRWDLVSALPAMRRTRDPEEARAFLRQLAGA